MDYKIEVNNLTKIFGRHPERGLNHLRQGETKDEIFEKTGMTVGVKQASFSVKPGETFVIMGLSGSGKSTLIRLVNRLIEPTDGEIYIDGENITKMSASKLIETRRRKLAMVFQGFGLLPHRTILYNVAYGLVLRGVDKTERERKALKTIEDVGLSGLQNSYPSELSGGMKQRVGLARALVNDADILLMDEAFSALDPLIRKEMQDELIQLQQSLDKTILFITHDLDEALKLGDRIAIMKDGEIVQIGTPEEILENPKTSYVANFVKDVDRSKVLKASNVMEKAETVNINKDSTATAVQIMKNLDLSSIFVVDDKKQLKGILTFDNAMEASHESISWEKIQLEEVSTTTAETPLNDLIDRAIKTPYPIAVIEDNTLLGRISRVDILSGLVLGKDQAEEVMQ